MSHDSLTSLPDEALCRLAAQGSGEAEELLVLRYVRLVRACAHPLFLMGGDNEDLIQEGMLGLLSAIRAYSQSRGSSFPTYAETCIKNRLISAIRSAASKHHTPLNDSVPIDPPLFDEQSHHLRASPETNPESILILRENVRERLDALRSRLSAFESNVLELYLSGLSYTEIAIEMNRPLKSVDNAVQRIRRKLASQN